MKQFLFLLLTLGFMVSCNTKSKAQVLMYKTTGNLSAITTQKTDTLTNAGTTYAINKTTLESSVSPNLTFQFTATNISGTSTFKVVLQGSNNGSDWYPLTNVPGTDGRNCDTLQCTSVTTAKQFIMTVRPGGGKTIPTYSTTISYYNTSNRYAYVRAVYLGAGTQSTLLANPVIKTSN